MDTKTVLWVDLQTSTGSADLAAEFGKLCRVHKIVELDGIAAAVRKFAPVGIFFEYDIPSEPLLEPLANTVIHFPKVPAVLITEQHSESLAVWALRARVWDYVVKPIDLSHLDLLLKNLASGETQKAGGNWLLRQIFRAEQISEPVKGIEKSRVSEELIAGANEHHTDRREKRLKPALTFVEANFAEKVTLGAAARTCGLGRYQFSRAFKQAHGKTFREFLIIHRIQKAVQLLRIDDLSITEVAFSVGFNDLSHFAQMFRRYVGVCPSDYVHDRKGK